jgi:glycogen debranching enzyme
VTPRAGRTVELNALWFNALMTASVLASRLGNGAAAKSLEESAERVKAAFNQRFWNGNLQFCYDVLGDEGNDAALRPNQVLAISLPHAVLNSDRRIAVLQRVRDELQTPYGVRSLGPREAGYQGKYLGNIVSRDSAQHQGSVYPWLIGPLATAYLKIHGRGESERATVLKWIEPCLGYMEGDGLGQLRELFDGDAPHAPRGAIASALGVAEILRVYAREVLGISSLRTKPRPISPLPEEPQAVGGTRK